MDYVTNDRWIIIFISCFSTSSNSLSNSSSLKSWLNLIGLKIIWLTFWAASNVKTISFVTISSLETLLICLVCFGCFVWKYCDPYLRSAKRNNFGPIGFSESSFAARLSTLIFFCLFVSTLHPWIYALKFSGFQLTHQFCLNWLEKKYRFKFFNRILEFFFLNSSTMSYLSSRIKKIFNLLNKIINTVNSWFYQYFSYFYFISSI